MSKLKFDLECPVDCLDRRLIVSAHQTYNEQELIEDITPIFYSVDPRLNIVGRRFHEQLTGDIAREDGPAWIYSGSDSCGGPHRIGISVAPRFLDQLIQGLINNGYEVN